MDIGCVVGSENAADLLSKLFISKYTATWLFMRNNLLHFNLMNNVIGADEMVINYVEGVECGREGCKTFGPSCAIMVPHGSNLVKVIYFLVLTDGNISCLEYQIY